MTIDSNVMSKPYKAACERLTAALAESTAIICALCEHLSEECDEVAALRITVADLRAELVRCRRDWNAAEQAEAERQQ